MIILKRLIIFILIFVPVVFVFFLIISIIKSLVKTDKAEKTLVEEKDYTQNLKHYYDAYRNNWFRHLLSIYYVFDFKIDPKNRSKILENSKRLENPPERRGAIADFDFIPISDRHIAEKNLQSVVSEEIALGISSVNSVQCIRFLNDYFKLLAGIEALKKVKPFVPDSGVHAWQNAIDKLLEEKEMLIRNFSHH